MDYEARRVRVREAIMQHVKDAARTQELEAAVAEAAADEHEYVDALRTLLPALSQYHGLMPDETLGVMFGRGDVSITTVLAAGPEPPGPRRVIARALAAALCCDDRQRVTALATELEQACFDRAIEEATTATAPPRRAWDSEQFVDIYSTRCGFVLSLLNPLEPAAAVYGHDFVADLLAGRVSPRTLGHARERDLCPEALEAERQDIARRSEQRVQEKASQLYKCPHCGARRCTYTQVQTRAIDEAADIFCVCLDCGRAFKGA